MKAEGIQSRSPFSGKKNEELAIVKIVGNLARTPDGKRKETQKIQTPIKVGTLLGSLTVSLGLKLPRESTLVLVNGVEANALEDLETIIQAGDVVFLVPMIHGGSGP